MSAVKDSPGRFPLKAQFSGLRQQNLQLFEISSSEGIDWYNRPLLHKPVRVTRVPIPSVPYLNNTTPSLSLFFFFPRDHNTIMALLPTRPYLRGLTILIIFFTLLTGGGLFLHLQTSGASTARLTDLLTGDSYLRRLTLFNTTEINEELGSGLAVENFASLGHRAPPIRPENAPPAGAPPTPLFIGFTRNWPLLQQAVVSYLAAGWPASQIYVVDNTGTMDSNARGLLTLQNPFFMNYTRLQTVLGVNVVTAPTLLSFAQLQNFFLWTAVEKGWTHYWWSHMDSVAVSWEDKTPYQSLHRRVLEDFLSSGMPEHWDWGLKFFRYDRLALVNVAAYKDVGAWDTHIPFYGTDCDFHSRLTMKGWKMPNVEVGMVFDVGATLEDLGMLYPENPEEPLDSERFKTVIRLLDEIDRDKHHARTNRNFWQGMQRGGQSEPFWRDPVVSAFYDPVESAADGNRASRRESVCGLSLAERCSGISGRMAIAKSSKPEGSSKMPGRRNGRTTSLDTLAVDGKEWSL
jgi:hypothetical protein